MQYPISSKEPTRYDWIDDLVCKSALRINASKRLLAETAHLVNGDQGAKPEGTVSERTDGQRR